MSGGAIGQYGYHRLRDAAAELRGWVANGGHDPDPTWVHADTPPLRPETLARFEQAAALMEQAAEAWRDVDYLLASDTGEDSWLSQSTWHEKLP